MPKRAPPKKRKLAPKIVSVCVDGKPAPKRKHNKRRGRALSAIVRSILAKDRGRIDAVLLLGGYSYLAKRISKLDHNARVAALQREWSFPAMKKASQSLSRHHPGAVLVLGLDSKPKGKGHSWNQIYIALRAGKIVAVAPKIFPTKGDGRDNGSVIVPNTADYGADQRFVDLPCGRRARLCTCYDAFGVAEAITGPGRRASLIRWLYTTACRRHRVRDRDAVAKCIRAWRDVRCAGTASPGRDGYWQRHGISTASAALQGALSVGAAHFRRLPSNIKKSRLSDQRAPESLLRLGNKRPLRTNQPVFGDSQATPIGQKDPIVCPRYNVTPPAT
jgi:hypothetical protein